MQHLAPVLEEFDESLEVYELLFTRLKQWPESLTALAFAPRYVRRLVGADDAGLARKIVQQCELLDDGFRLDTDTRALLDEALATGPHSRH